jgi:predicted O-methyltransferase YrrM
VAETTQELWTQVDEYFSAKLLPDDRVLEAALEGSVKAGLPAIAVSPNQGKMLEILARVLNATAILEIGTLGGYSTICLARGLRRGGKLITLEIDPRHAEVAENNIARAGLDDTVEIRIGAALDILPQLSAHSPFDLIFIDADKANIPSYFEWAIKLARSGAIIIVDNVVRDGGVIDEHSTDPSIQGVRLFIEMLAADTRVEATTIQTVGVKGYDGFTIARVR